MDENNVQKGFEFEGADVEEAIQAALDALKVSRDDLKIKIVNEEKKGLFGMEGAEPAKIKVFIKKEDNTS